MIRSAIFRRLKQDRTAAAAVDFAMTLPIITLLTVGVMQLGVAFLANAGLRNAVEVGARFAVIFPYPSDTDIQNKVRANAFGMEAAQLTVSAPVRGTANGQSFVQVTASYPLQLNFVVLSTPAFTISYTRRSDYV